MKYAILGPVEVWHENAPRRAGGPRERKVLAALLLQANRVVAIGRLIDAVWGERPPATAKAQIHNSIAALRRNLVTTGGERIPIARVEAGYVLRIPDDLVDATQFTRLAADADKLAGEGDLAGAVRLRREALRPWRGPALDQPATTRVPAATGPGPAWTATTPGPAATGPGPAGAGRTRSAPETPVPAQLPAATPDFTGRTGPLADLDGMMPTGGGATGAVV